MKKKYAKRIAIFSIVFGSLSFFGNFGLGPSELDGPTFVLVFILTITMIVIGSMITSRIKKENYNIKTLVYILLGIYCLMAISLFINIIAFLVMTFDELANGDVIPLFINIIAHLVMIAFVAFPLYSGYRYITFKNDSEKYE
ncbi:MAG TPA: hypothetical protein PKK61_04090 [Defluviitaleaceae bacterium]|nr:hypothetical protein [Defluviitaleaceae bacterium]